MMKRGIKITTFMGAGVYQHKVYDINVGNKRELAVSDEVVEMQKKVNEKLYEEIPEGSGLITSIINYVVPKK